MIDQTTRGHRCGSSLVGLPAVQWVDSGRSTTLQRCQDEAAVGAFSAVAAPSLLIVLVLLLLLRLIMSYPLTAAGF